MFVIYSHGPEEFTSREWTRRPKVAFLGIVRFAMEAFAWCGKTTEALRDLLRSWESSL